MNQFPGAVRPFIPEADFPRLLRLLGEVEAVDHDGEDISEDTQRMYLTLPHHDPAQDRWVIDTPADPGRLIGFASTWARTVWGQACERAESYIAVHPHWRRSGLGRALLDRLTQRARELGADHTIIHANERHQGSNAFLLKHNFQPVGSYWLLKARLNDQVEEPHWPDGYTVHSYATVQDRAVVAKAMESYRDRWGHYGPRPDAPPVPWLAGLDPEGVFLAFAPNGEPVGICVAVRQAESGVPTIASDGHINGPGVLPGHRDQGLHRLLTLAALRWQQSLGCQTITLDAWGDDAQTIALYRDLGFEPVHHLISYRQQLS
ncbi:MAG: GNAT family N-acetyltransferase [Chloroflexi bacterium]|nr:GNAT family N-acetyltransferase [Chloroflexota bacterium]